MVLARRRLVVLVALTGVAVAVLGGVRAGALHVDTSRLSAEPVPDAELVGTGTRHRPVPVGGLTAAQARVLREVPGATRSGRTVVVPTRLVQDATYGVVAGRDLDDGVLALYVHAYTQPWDWTGVLTDSSPSLAHPAPGAVVGDLGPAYVGCRPRPDGRRGCSFVTVVRDEDGRWRQVADWSTEWGGVTQWPYGPRGALQVQVYPDLAARSPAYVVVGVVHGPLGSAQVRTVEGAVESVSADRERVARGTWTFRTLVPDAPTQVTAYDARGRELAAWGGPEPRR